MIGTLSARQGSRRIDADQRWPPVSHRTPAFWHHASAIRERPAQSAVLRIEDECQRPTDGGRTAPADSSWAARQAGHGRAGQAEDGIACLDALAAQMRARGWTAYISTPAGRLAFLSVQDRHDRAEGGDIIAAPGGTTGDWWYWFSWAERIAPVNAPATATDAIIRAVQRRTDGPQAPHLPVANGR